MGSISVPALLPRPKIATDDSEEIRATREDQVPVPVMRVDFDREGNLVFCGEIPVLVRLTWRVVDDGARQRHRWWRLEVKASSDRSGIQAGDSLIVAAYPYGSGWIRHAPFKSGLGKGKAPGTSMSRHDGFPSRETCIEFVEDLDHDPWEEGTSLTAGLPEPELPFQVGPTRRFDAQDLLLVFACCTDFAARERTLLESQGAEQLMNAAREQETVDARDQEPRRGGGPEISRVAREQVEALLRLSVRQALAGPHTGCDSWTRRPVTEKLAEVFGEHERRRKVHDKTMGWEDPAFAERRVSRALRTTGEILRETGNGRIALDFLWDHASELFTRRASVATTGPSAEIAALVAQVSRRLGRQIIVDFPARCRVDAQARLFVQLPMAGVVDAALSELMSVPVLSPFRDSLVTVQVTATGFRSRTRRARMCVPIDSDSDVVTFDLEAIAPGTQIVEIELFTGADRIGYVTVVSKVVAHAG